jgi:hypothetical protein
VTERERRERNLKALKADDDLIAETTRLNGQLHAWLEGRRTRWLIGSLAVFIVLAVLTVLSIGIVRNTQRAERNVKRIDRLQADGAARDFKAKYADCREGNLPTAFVRLTIGRYLPPAARRDADRKLPILWCYATVQLGMPVRLSPEEERRYLRVYDRSRLPVVDTHGHVVGSQPLPAPRR